MYLGDLEPIYGTTPCSWLVGWRSTS